MEDRSKRVMTILTVFTIIFTVIGSSLAYWSWNTSESQRTSVTFTATTDFTCAADGGGNITANSESGVTIVPTTCANSSHVIKRTVKVSPTINTSGKTIYMDLWLDVNELGEGLSDSQNFSYALTTGSSSCSDGIVTSGNFNGKVAGDKVSILNNKDYSSTTTETYYLWIWLDAEEKSTATMNQTFDLSLNGECTDIRASEPEAPVLDSGMIPVTISDNGIVTTISENDDSWYDYSNQEWANVVLVKEEGTQARSYYQNNTGVEVESDDILGYYVWIPRYSYAISELKCSEVTSVNETDYPSCYKFILSDSDKTTLITWWQAYYVEMTGDTTYTVEQATTEINNGLETGIYSTTIMGAATSVSMVEFISMYNSENETAITYTTEFNSNSSVTGPRSVNIMFESKSSTKSVGTAVGTSYRTHPAFTFGSDELAGIWVGKFETSTDKTSTCYSSWSNCNNTDQSPRVLPNVTALTYQTVSNQFQTSLKFSGGTLSNGTVSFNGSSTYGLAKTTDSHMMKNSEWGAVAYLSHSVYGINDEIRINNYYDNGTFKTGCGAAAENGSSTTTCEIVYGSGVSSYPQSTTGNISGIFDMSGGTWEYVMGVFANSDGDLYSGYSSSGNSGFTGIVYDDGSNNSYTGISFPSNKYFDTYKATSGTTIDATTACDGGICYGHALSETSGWYSDYAAFVSSSGPWFSRGGYYGGGSGAGAFYFGNDNGHASNYDGFRSVLVA